MINSSQRLYVNSLRKKEDYPIYTYKLYGIKNMNDGDVLIKWKVTPEDTLYEENGKSYIMREVLNKNGKVKLQKRYYDAIPKWTKRIVFTPENIVYPCQIFYNDKLYKEIFFNENE
jgi:hypothetical protein